MSTIRPPSAIRKSPPATMLDRLAPVKAIAGATAGDVVGGFGGVTGAAATVAAAVVTAATVSGSHEPASGL